MEDDKTNPLVFISYSWDNEEHEKWVRQLASDLIKNGIDVRLDQWENKIGSDIPYFMDDSINRAERVLCILTPNYKEKADQRKGGVGYEIRNMTAKIFTDVITNKFIPVLRKGTPKDAIPIALSGRVFIDMRDDSTYNDRLIEILREVFGKPKYTKPELGVPPIFD